MKVATVAVLGGWHLAHVTAAGLAGDGHRTLFVPEPDALNAEAKKKFRKPQLFEPGLEEAWTAHLDRHLFVHSLDEAAAEAPEAFFLALDTPVDDQDLADLDAVLKYVHALARLPRREQPALLVVQSQVPVGTCRKIQCELEGRFEVVCMPENLRLGKALALFTQPEFMYLGGSARSIARVRALFANWSCVVRELELEEAELVKHSTNFYLALCVSYSSFLSDLCEDLGVSASKVVDVLKLDTRVSPRAPLSPGFGFAGGTLGRDVQVLRGLAGKLGEFKAFGDAVYDINLNRVPRLVRLIQGKVPRGSKIALIGLTYKVGTDTLRRSHALTISRALTDAGYGVAGFDPKVSAAAHPEVAAKTGLSIETSLDRALEGARSAILCTPWPELLQHDWAGWAMGADGRSFFDLTGQSLASFQGRAEALPRFYTPGFNPAAGARA